MIRTVLHGADFHLDSPFSGLSPEQAARRRQEQRGLLDRLVTLANEEKADVVLANLFSAVLVKAFARLKAAMKPKNSILIISGILNSQAEETLAAARAEGLKVLKVVSRGKWTTAKLTHA